MIKLITEIQSIQQSNNGAITGVIYVSVDGKMFPEKGWNDLIIVILNFWIDELNNMTEKHSGGEFFFMDGPFRFKLSTTKTDSHFEGFDGKKLIISAKVDFKHFKDTIIDFAKMVNNYTENRGWKSTDMVSLKRKLSAVSL
jgi:hypothetical protein